MIYGKLTCLMGINILLIWLVELVVVESGSSVGYHVTCYYVYHSQRIGPCMSMNPTTSKLTRKFICMLCAPSRVGMSGRELVLISHCHQVRAGLWVGLNMLERRGSDEPSNKKVRAGVGDLQLSPKLTSTSLRKLTSQSHAHIVRTKVTTKRDLKERKMKQYRKQNMKLFKTFPLQMQQKQSRSLHLANM